MIMNDSHVLGIDIGGTNTRLSVFRRNKILNDAKWELRFPTKHNYSDLLDIIKENSENIKSFKICDIGISIGVELSSDGKTIIASSKLPDYVGHDFHEDIACIFNVKPVIAHDCVCAVIAENSILNNTENIAYITISSGIGGAILLKNGNKVIAFRTRLAHHIIDRRGDLCHCGQIGCLASFIDGKELEKKYNLPLESINDISFWKDFTTFVSIGLVNISWLFPITTIIIGGGIALNQPYVKNNLKETFKSIRSSGKHRECKILFSQFGEKASIIGACLLNKNKIKVIY